MALWNESLNISMERKKKSMELFRVLQKANLSLYYDAFISQGGDDVSQLADAEESEFLEIMRVVGMSNKPLHIRRLQKALEEWRSNPDKFRVMNDVNFTGATASGATSAGNMRFDPNSMAAATMGAVFHQQQQDDQLRNFMNSTAFQPHGAGTRIPFPMGNSVQGNALMNTIGITSQQVKNNLGNGASLANTPGSAMLGVTGQGVVTGAGNSVNKSRTSTGIPVSLLPNATLKPNQRLALEQAAEEFVKAIPEYPVKESMARRRKEAGLYEVINMPSETPHRTDAIYRFAAIYGRFDKPRKTGKPMNMHEVMVNEAAAQLAIRMPSLLSRREDLYPLARQVVKIAEDGQKDGSRRSRGNKKRDQAIMNNIASQINNYFSSDTQTGLMRLQSRIEQTKNELCDLVAQQDKLRLAFRAAKNGSIGQSMSDIQKQIDNLSGLQQTKMAEQARLVLELRKYQNNPSNTGSFSQQRSSSVTAPPGQVNLPIQFHANNFPVFPNVSSSTSGVQQQQSSKSVLCKNDAPNDLSPSTGGIGGVSVSKSSGHYSQQQVASSSAGSQHNFACFSVFPTIASQQLKQEQQLITNVLAASTSVAAANNAQGAQQQPGSAAAGRGVDAFSLLPH